MDNDQSDKQSIIPNYNNLKLLNLLCFIIAMISNGQQGSRGNQVVITKQWSLTISPSGYAFAIWGIIQLLLMVLIIYQVFPDNQISSNHNELIQMQMGYLLCINLIANAIWLPTFDNNKPYTFILSFLIILTILYTSVSIMQESIHLQLNWIEVIGLRVGFSIYSGWVTAATILNGAFVFKAQGMREETGYDENLIGCAILWVGCVVQNWVQVDSLNPLQGAVYLWVLIAISHNNDRLNKSARLGENISIICQVHSGLTISLLVYNIVQYFRGKVTQGFLY